VRSRIAAHVHGRTNSSSVAAVVHPACCSAYPSSATRAPWMAPHLLDRQKNERFPGATPHAGFPQALTIRKLVR